MCSTLKAMSGTSNQPKVVLLCPKDKRIRFVSGDNSTTSATWRKEAKGLRLSA